MQPGLLDELSRFLEWRSDPLRNAAILLCALVFAGGLAELGIRVKSIRRGPATPGSLLVWRMIAVLGALGGFVTYLRDLPRPGARFGLFLGGVSALPWALAILLEAVRRRRGSRGTGEGGE